jgi:hypothetical protein
MKLAESSVVFWNELHKIAPPRIGIFPALRKRNVPLGLDLTAIILFEWVLAYPNSIDSLEALPHNTELSWLGKFCLRRMEGIYILLEKKDSQKSLWRPHLKAVRMKMEDPKKGDKKEGHP